MNHYQVVRLNPVVCFQRRPFWTDVVYKAPHLPTTHAAWSGVCREVLKKPEPALEDPSCAYPGPYQGRGFYGRQTVCGAHLRPDSLLHLASEVTCVKCRKYIRLHALVKETAGV